MGFKKRRFYNVSLILAIILILQTVFIPNETSANTDLTPPELEHFSVSTTEAKVGETIDFTVKADDDSSGVHYARVIYDSPQRNQYIDVSIYNEDSNSTSLNGMGSYVVRELDQEGVWELATLIVMDRAGNETRFEAEDFKGIYDITIQNENTDITAPTLDEFSVSTTEASVGEKIDFNVKAQDDGSGVHYARVIYDSPQRNQYIDVSIYNEDLNSTSLNGIGSYVVRELDQEGVWELATLIVMDRAGNETRFGAEDFNGKYDITIQNENTDITAPTLEDFSVSTTEALVGERINFNVKADDDASGVHYARVIYDSPQRNQYIDVSIYNEDLNSTSLNGSGSYVVRELDQEGVWELATLIIMDRAGNETRFGASDFNGKYDIHIYNNDDRKMEEVKTDIPYQTVTKEDPTLEQGKKVIEQQGLAGEKVMTYVVTYKNGEEVHRELKSEKVTREPVDQIIIVGTKMTDREDDSGEKDENHPRHIHVTLGKEYDVRAHDTISIEVGQTKSTITMPGQLPQGTKLIVEDASELIDLKNEHLVLAGNVLDVSIFDANNQNVVGPYLLTMEYDKDQYGADDVDIYYYDENQGIWVKQHGTVNEEEGTITIEVDHFSRYGVFTTTLDDEESNEEENTLPNPEDEESNEESIAPNPEDTNSNEEGTLPNIEETDTNGENTVPATEATDASEGNTLPARENTDSNKGNTLPNTATNTYNILLIGLVLIMLGGCTLLLSRRKAI
ncbi:G5 domain-containing protein [Alkalicoccobacillus porphyridii]|uniref:LPXTG cell wall anchor domain-containing protein n=1 Tax=Alkalicoccobacillus porphyridii TaxID=2597270 RepID=A0A554A1C7_9BACI|nr:G5 domain-containing protein [Alkalicoccobacillus porphyridii]TSB47501.1 LPXTG cell wall anchor domain-containing protein [Alkalicoccobacillus porphyridii]